VLNASRQYSLSLSPSIIPSVGPLISSLISSGVSRYGGYRLLERVGIYHSPGVVNPVPGSKEAVFKSKDISLVEKRRLMRFLAFAAGEFEGSKELVGKEELPILDLLRKDFSLNDDIASAIVYSLAYCATSSGQHTATYIVSPGYLDHVS
jgi:Rab proteins geranylgeranyltransferase component A